MINIMTKVRLFISNHAPRLIEALCVVISLNFYVYALLRNSYLEFDESNSLYIASQSFGSIIEILRHEQNFPLYYFLLHILKGYLIVIKTLNLLVWLATLFFAQRIFARLIQSPIARASCLLAFALIPYLFHYVFYSRMYGLTTLLIVIQIDALQNIGKNESALVQGRLCALIETMLHPLGIIAAFLYLLAERKTLVRWDRGTVWTTVLTSLIFIVHVASKAGPMGIYFTHGTKYLKLFHRTFADQKLTFYASALFTDLAMNSAIYLFFLGTCLVGMAAIISKKLYQRSQFRPILLLASPFLLLPLFFPYGVAEHHIAFFIAPFSLAIIVGCYEALQTNLLYSIPFLAIAVLVWKISWEKPWFSDSIPWAHCLLYEAFLFIFSIFYFFQIKSAREKNIKVVISIVVLIFCGLICRTYLNKRMSRDLHRSLACTYFQNLNPLEKHLIFTNYTDYNIVMAGLKKNTSNSVIWVDGKNAPFDTTNRNPLAILRRQAFVGGTSILMTHSLSDYFNSSLKIRTLVTKYHPDKIIISYSIQPCSSSTLSQVKFPGYHWKECASPYQFVFTRDIKPTG
jgi:hypothetical protein